MNTRLQVEHPVTELVWDVDLVAEQLRVAAGEELSPELRDRTPSGHAIEARLYAEDPAAGFLPASGTIRRWREPALKGVRVDAGVAEGTVVGTDYDPMLAKLIAHGPDRETAIGRLRRALDDLELLGVANSAAFSSALLDREDVRRGELDTGLVERALADLDLGPPEDLLAAAAVALLRADTAGLGIAAGPWRRRFAGLGEVRIGDGELSCERGSWAFESRELSDGRLLVSLDGLTRTYAISIDAGRAAVWVGRDGHQLEARLERRDIRDAAPLSGSLEAPMPGKVLLIEVANGDRVEEGDALIVLESMKMELQITAPRAGTVEGLTLAVGDRVGQGDALLAVTAATEAGEEER